MSLLSRIDGARHANRISIGSAILSALVSIAACLVAAYQTNRGLKIQVQQLQQSAAESENSRQIEASKMLAEARELVLGHQIDPGKNSLVLIESNPTALGRAVFLVRFARSMAPDHLRLPETEALVAIAGGHWTSAAEAAERFIAKEPHNDNAWGVKAVALHGLQQTEKSLECLDKAISIDPKNYSYHFNAGQAACLLGKWQRALDYFTAGVQCSPNNADCHTMIGFTLAMMGQHSLARERLGRAQRMGNRSGNSHAFAGDAYGRLNDPKLQLEEYRQAWGKSRSDCPFLFNFALSLHNNDLPDEALDVLARLNDLAPDHPEAKKLRIRCLRKCGRYYEAFSLEKRLGLSPVAVGNHSIFESSMFDALKEIERQIPPPRYEMLKDRVVPAATAAPSIHK